LAVVSQLYEAADSGGGWATAALAVMKPDGSVIRSLGL
jgi:hypothetical protein